MPARARPPAWHDPQGGPRVTRSERKQFEQLLADFPESPLAPDAKRVAEAIRKAGS